MAVGDTSWQYTLFTPRTCSTVSEAWIANNDVTSLFRHLLYDSVDTLVMKTRLSRHALGCIGNN